MNQVRQGMSVCSCEPTIADLVPAPPKPWEDQHVPPLPILPTELTSFELPPSVPEVYRAGKFGVRAVVQMSGRDAEILTRMGNAAVLLLALANEMNQLQGFMASTRAVIKAARTLASDLQEEIEVRIGPQG